jgi:hypothetical protein
VTESKPAMAIRTTQNSIEGQPRHCTARAGCDATGY